MTDLMLPQHPANHPANHTPLAALQLEAAVEAARYALLRRLAPALRHNMAGALQPVSMIAAMLEKRLSAPVPDLAAMAKNTSAISTLSREAAAACMDLMTWLAPKENALVAVGTGVTDAVSLLVTELSFRGFSVRNELGDMPGLVLCSALRSVFMAGLVALTDAATAPADVVLTAHIDGDDMVLAISLIATTGEVMSLGNSPAYRNLRWPDVQALADAESVGLVWSASRVELRFRAGR